MRKLFVVPLLLFLAIVPAAFGGHGRAPSTAARSTRSPTASSRRTSARRASSAATPRRRARDRKRQGEGRRRPGRLAPAPGDRLVRVRRRTRARSARTAPTAASTSSRPPPGRPWAGRATPPPRSEAEQDRRAAMLYARSGAGPVARLRLLASPGPPGCRARCRPCPTPPSGSRPCGRRRSRAPHRTSVAGSSQTVHLSSDSSSRPRHRRTNALFSHSSPTVVGIGVARVQAGLGRQLHQQVHDRRLEVLEAGGPGAFTPPTEPLNSVSPVNTSVPLTTKLSIPSVWPGVCSAPIFRPPTSSTFTPGLDRAVHVQQLARPPAGGPGSPRRTSPCRRGSRPRGRRGGGSAAGASAVRSVLLDRLQQRPGRAAGVDDHRRARRARRPRGRRWTASRGLHGAFDDHGPET